MTSIAEDVPERFELIELLGEGSYGAVFKGRDRITEDVYAIKVLELDDLDGSDDIQKEISILSKCNHSNIVRYFRSFRCCVGVDKLRKSQLWILMDHCGGGSLRDFIEMCELTLSESHISYVMRSTLSALNYLHSMSIVHRDVKAANILLHETGVPKIADFGVSKEITTAASKHNTVIGTPLWMSPEVIQGIPYNHKADIWSLGITAIELADGAPPHCDLHPMKAMFKIPFCPPPTVEHTDEFSDEFNDFIAKCLIKDPEQRPTAAELLEHPFIVNGPTESSVLLEVVERYVEAKREREEQKRLRRAARLLSSQNLNLRNSTTATTSNNTNGNGTSNSGDNSNGSYESTTPEGTADYGRTTVIYGSSDLMSTASSTTEGLSQWETMLINSATFGGGTSVFHMDGDGEGVPAYMAQYARSNEGTATAVSDVDSSVKFSESSEDSIPPTPSSPESVCLRSSTGTHGTTSNRSGSTSPTSSTQSSPSSSSDRLEVDRSKSRLGTTRELRRRASRRDFKSIAFPNFTSTSNGGSSASHSATSTLVVEATPMQSSERPLVQTPVSQYPAKFDLYDEPPLNFKDVALAVLSVYVILHFMGYVD